MTIEEAKQELEQIRPKSDALYQLVKAAKEHYDHMCNEWTKVSRRVDKLNAFIELGEQP